MTEAQIYDMYWKRFTYTSRCGNRRKGTFYNCSWGQWYFYLKYNYSNEIIPNFHLRLLIRFIETDIYLYFFTLSSFLVFFDGPQIILFRYSLFYHVLYSCLPLDSDHALRWTTFLTSFHNDRTGNVVINCHGIMKCFSLSHALDKTKTFFFQKFIC